MPATSARKVVTVYALAVLAAFTNIKIASLQLSDFVLLILFSFCLVKASYLGFSFRISAKASGLLKSYSLLILTLLLLAVFAVRQTFYPLQEVSFLKKPLLFSFSKLLQQAAVICGFLWLTNTFTKDKRLLAQGLSLYWWTGIFSSAYAIVCYVALVVTHLAPGSSVPLIGAYDSDGFLKARGFFNEGGPFGLYLVSVIAVGLIRRKVSGKSLGIVNPVILLLAFLMSASKAGFFVIAIMALYAVVSAASFKKKIAYLLVAATFVCGVSAYLHLPDLLLGYVDSYQNIESKIALAGRDPNLVMGRVAAAYIVPRMIAAHPLAGIGVGNYPLIRNEPHYLGNLPTITDVEDLPALGIPSIAAEMGIPVTLWLLVLLCIPFKVSRKRGAILGVVAIFQPLAHSLGVQLTFFYPWFVSACVLAASSYGTESHFLSRMSRLRKKHYLLASGRVLSEE